MSFSQEMKDFLGAYSSGQKINASRTDQDYKEQLTAKTKAENEENADPESVTNKLADLSLQKAQQSLSQSAQSHADAHAAHGERMRQAALLRSQGAIVPGSGLVPASSVGPTGPVPQGQGAIPLAPRQDMIDSTEEYADGGLVPDEPDDPNAPDEVEPQNVGAVPINPINQDPRLAAQPTPADAPTDVSARRRSPGLDGVISPALVRDATKAGMTYGAKEYGLAQTGAVQTPAQQARARLFAQGHGGLTTEELEAAKQAVDPQGKLSDAQRNAAALGSVYQYWANKGDADKAGRVAFQMLQSYRMASQRYAAIAAHAAQGGQMDLATKAAMKAYANVPDGNDVELVPNPNGGIMYHVTGPNGEDITKGVATPQQLYAQASGLASGGFDKALLTAAGQAEAKGAVNAGGGKPQTAADRKVQAEGLISQIGKLQAQDEKNNEKTPDNKLPPEYWDGVQNTATHIMQQNPHMTDNEAVAATHKMLSTKDPEKPDFQMVPNEDGGGYKVSFGKKLKFDIDDQQFDAITTSLAARVKLQKEQDAKDDEEGDKPTFGEKFKEASDKIDEHALGMLKGPAQAIGTMGQIAGRLGRGAIDATTMDTSAQDEAVRNAAAAVADRLKNKGAIPIDDNDRPI